MTGTIMELMITPILFGLFGFIEPCTIGSTLIFIKYLEGQALNRKMTQVVSFALVRALFMGLLGVSAALLGQSSEAIQKPLWVVFGSFYLILGLVYIAGKSNSLKFSLGPKISNLSGYKGSVLLGFLFAFNIPACASPLLLALLTDAAAKGAAGGSLLHGFISISVFGLALSLPLIMALFFSRKVLDRLANFSSKAPRWTGVLLILLGLWSLWFGLHVKN